MTESLLIVRDFGAVRAMWIDRPERLNALNSGVFRLLDEELGRAAAQVEVRVVVILGRGERAFSAGADLEELADRSPVATKSLLERGQAVFRKLELLGKPTIAGVDGFALGGGFELALSCSFALASENARLGLPEVGLGLIPGYGGTQRLPRLIGRAAALRMMLSGDQVDAAEAFRMGIVAEPPLPADGFEDAVVERAERLARQSPVAQSLILGAVGGGQGFEGALATETAYASLATSSEDGHEGITAFLEHRKPSFSGRLA